jgi:hypothetical protein
MDTAIENLIEAAERHARALRRAAYSENSEYLATATESTAAEWEVLVKDARQALIRMTRR